MTAGRRLSRRELLGRAGAGAVVGIGLASGIRPAEAAGSRRSRRVAPNDRVVLGLIGCGGMGAANMRTLMGKPEVEVAALCDVDSNRIPNDAADVEKKYGRKPMIC